MEVSTKFEGIKVNVYIYFNYKAEARIVSAVELNYCVWGNCWPEGYGKLKGNKMQTETMLD